jgi:hypothetical protein
MCKIILLFVTAIWLEICVPIASSFSIIPHKATKSSGNFRSYFINTELRANSDDGDEEPNLILGDDVQKSIQGLGQDNAYLQAARARNNDAARLKLLEEERLEQEEAERKRQARSEGGGESNFGPGDLSDFQGFADDGFEASVGNDDELAWGKTQGQNEENGEDADEPKLFLFDDEGGASDGSGLIL